MAYFIFKEKQKFDQPWLWAILLTGYVVILITILTAAWELSRQVASPLFGGDWTSIIIGFTVLNLIPLLFLTLKLETRIDGNGIRYRYPPFIPNWRKLPKENIDSIELKRAKSPLGFGGWGIRYNMLTGFFVYNVRGKYGIRIVSGKKKFIIGTQKPMEAELAIRQLLELKEEENAK